MYVNETKYTIADLIPNTSYDIFIESINDQKPSDVITFEVKTSNTLKYKQFLVHE